MRISRLGAAKESDVGVRREGIDIAERSVSQTGGGITVMHELNRPSTGRSAVPRCQARRKWRVRSSTRLSAASTDCTRAWGEKPYTRPV